MVTINRRPSYYTIPLRSTANPKKTIPNMFRVIEDRDGETFIVCELSNRGDRLNNLLKRGIPLEDAKNLFYQMDGM